MKASISNAEQGQGEAQPSGLIICSFIRYRASCTFHVLQLLTHSTKRLLMDKIPNESLFLPMIVPKGLNSPLNEKHEILFPTSPDYSLLSESRINWQMMNCSSNSTNGWWLWVLLLEKKTIRRLRGFSSPDSVRRDSKICLPRKRQNQLEKRQVSYVYDFRHEGNDGGTTFELLFVK